MQIRRIVQFQFLYRQIETLPPEFLLILTMWPLRTCGRNLVSHLGHRVPSAIPPLLTAVSFPFSSSHYRPWKWNHQAETRGFRGKAQRSGKLAKQMIFSRSLMVLIWFHMMANWIWRVSSSLQYKHTHPSTQRKGTSIVSSQTWLGVGERSLCTEMWRKANWNNGLSSSLKNRSDMPRQIGKPGLKTPTSYLRLGLSPVSVWVLWLFPIN